MPEIDVGDWLIELRCPDCGSCFPCEHDIEPAPIKISLRERTQYLLNKFKMTRCPTRNQRPLVPPPSAW